MTQTIYPFKVYDSYLGKVLIGFANLNSEIVYDISYDEAIRADDKGHTYYVRKENLWYQLDSCNIVPLVEEPNIVPRKSYEPNIILEKDTRILDSTEDFYILINNFNEETVYNHRNVSIFDTWIHYKEYMINKYSKPIEKLEEYLEKLDKLKRNQILVFLKNIESIEVEYLYTYIKNSRSSVSKNLYKKLENCLAYNAWRFTEVFAENYRYFVYDFFDDETIEKLQTPLSIAKEHKGKIFEKFFVKAEKYVLSRERKTLFNPNQNEYKQEKTVDDYVEFSIVILLLAEKEGILAIDCLSQRDEYPILNEILRAWSIGIWRSSTEFFNLYTEQIKEQQSIKIKNYYRAIRLFISANKEFTHNSAIENIFLSYGISPKDTWDNLINQSDIENYTDLILTPDLIINIHNLDNLLEFMKYISLIKKHIDRDNFTIFQTKRSVLVKEVLDKVEEHKLPKEIKLWSRYTLRETINLSDILKYIENSEREKMNEVKNISELVKKLIEKLENNIK